MGYLHLCYLKYIASIISPIFDFIFLYKHNFCFNYNQIKTKNERIS